MGNSINKRISDTERRLLEARLGGDVDEIAKYEAELVFLFREKIKYELCKH